MTRRKCECGHPLDRHAGFFDDCLGQACHCRWFVEAPRFWYLRRVWRWLKAVPR